MRGVFRAGGVARPVVFGSVLAILVSGLWLGLAREESSARERRGLLAGRFELVVGFLDEPPFEGEPNGLYLRVTDSQAPTPTPDPDVTPTPAPAATPGVEPPPAPVTAFEAEVRYGDQTRPLDLVQDANDPTIYRAFFVPTQPGDYTFRIFGTLDGVEFDEEFRSSGNTFPGVAAIGDTQFPAEIPAGQALLDAFAEAEEDAGRARTFGVVGVLLGVAGLVAGGLSVVLSRRPPPPPAAQSGHRTPGGSGTPALTDDA